MFLLVIVNIGLYWVSTSVRIIMVFLEMKTSSFFLPLLEWLSQWHIRESAWRIEFPCTAFEESRFLRSLIDVSTLTRSLWGRTPDSSKRVEEINSALKKQVYETVSWILYLKFSWNLLQQHWAHFHNCINSHSLLTNSRCPSIFVKINLEQHNVHNK